MTTFDADDDFEIPEITDWSGFTRASGPRSSDGFGIVIDGAVGCSLRLIPSNKVIGRFSSTLEAWPTECPRRQGARQHA